MEDEFHTKEFYPAGKKSCYFKKSSGRAGKNSAFDKTFFFGTFRQRFKCRGHIVPNIKRYPGKETANTGLQEKSRKQHEASQTVYCS